MSQLTLKIKIPNPRWSTNCNWCGVYFKYYVHTLQLLILGGMLLLCDINEYRKCVNQWKIGFISKLFETLHGLSNLLVVVPENLNERTLVLLNYL